MTADKYTGATLNFCDEEGGWYIKKGTYPEMLVEVNALIARFKQEFGEPSNSNLVENPAADVLHVRWSSGVAIRFVMSKMPGYVTVYCPSCRTSILPKSHGGRGVCHGWVPKWETVEDVLVCMELTQNAPVNGE